MIIKQPAGYDVSHWKDIPDFNLVDPKPLLFITKATEAYPGIVSAGIDYKFAHNHTDSKFIPFAEGFISIGCIRGFYHFHRKVNPFAQAEHFLNIISKIDILPTDILILDVEEGGEAASSLWAWFETVHKAYPNNRLMLYSSKYILDTILMRDSEREYFKKIWTWSAGYPWFPDLFSTIPSGYIPDQSKYGQCVMWQYSAHGKVTGIKGDVDLNLMHPDLIASLGSNEVIGVTEQMYKGTCKVEAKVWRDVGMAQIDTVQAGKLITADIEKVVSGVKYLHLLTPVNGWSKALWFAYAPVTTTPPTEPPTNPPPVPTDEYIIHVKNGVSRKFILDE